MIQYNIARKKPVFVLAATLIGACVWPVLGIYAQDRLRPNKDRPSVPSKPSGQVFRRTPSAPTPKPQNRVQPAPTQGSGNPKQNQPKEKPIAGGINKATQIASENPATGALPKATASAMVAAKPLVKNALEAEAGEKLEPAAENSIVVATEAEKNQAIAPDWERPWACLMLTGRQHGYIEPCGCTGLENQKGGLNRRDTLLGSLRDRGWDVFPIDTGDQVRRRGRQSEIKFARTAEALKLMNYSAVMFGLEELKLSATDLYVSLTDQDGNFSSPFVAANVSILTPGTPDTIKIIQVGSKKIGITGVIGNKEVLGDNVAEAFRSDDITITPAVESLKRAAIKLKAAECDFLLLIAQASLEESADLARAVPVFDLVVTAGGYGEPFYRPEPIEGTKSVMLQVGVKGMYAGIVGLYDRTEDPILYQRVALSSQFEDSPRIMELFGKYQTELEQTSLEGLGLRPLSHPSTREFVGTETCGECHTTALKIWQDTPHAHATDSIINPPGRGQVPRHFDPECLSCHVTGWNAAEFHPYVSGYASLDSTPHLVGNGCENCHGPGSSHVAAESGDSAVSDEVIKRLREEMRLPLNEAQDRCAQCHDMDNSPNFHKENAFQEYWDQVKHVGKD